MRNVNFPAMLKYLTTLVLKYIQSKEGKVTRLSETSFQIKGSSVNDDILNAAAKIVTTSGYGWVRGGGPEIINISIRNVQRSWPFQVGDFVVNNKLFVIEVEASALHIAVDAMIRAAEEDGVKMLSE
jgi:hypothetical protein